MQNHLKSKIRFLINTLKMWSMAMNLHQYRFKVHSNLKKVSHWKSFFDSFFFILKPPKITFFITQHFDFHPKIHFCFYLAYMKHTYLYDEQSVWYMLGQSKIMFMKIVPNSLFFGEKSGNLIIWSNSFLKFYEKVIVILCLYQN